MKKREDEKAKRKKSGLSNQETRYVKISRKSGTVEEHTEGKNDETRKEKVKGNK